MTTVTPYEFRNICSSLPPQQAVGIDSAVYGDNYPIGLCPACGEPIAFKFISPRVLRIYHAFTGNATCSHTKPL